jgi:NAD-dependent SIR2 family protein deacetylase
MFLQRAADLIAQADALVIAAGAGMGVDSGLPDFRGDHGLWKQFPLVNGQNLDIMELASPQTFETDPELAWGFYGNRLAMYRQTRPHVGFEILKRWSKNKKFGAWVFTSNVDGQFQMAGFEAAQVEECHGSLHELQCVVPCTESVWSADALHPVVDPVSFRQLNPLPRCPHCGRLARPNVLMFNDYHFVYERTEGHRKRRHQWLTHVADSHARLLVIELGAGTTVVSVRHFSHLMARDYGANLVRINSRQADVDLPTDIGIAMPAAAALASIDRLLTAK